MLYEVHHRGNGIWDVRRENTVLASYWSQFDAENDAARREDADRFKTRLESR